MDTCGTAYSITNVCEETGVLCVDCIHGTAVVPSQIEIQGFSGNVLMRAVRCIKTQFGRSVMTLQY